MIISLPLVLLSGHSEVIELLYGVSARVAYIN